LLACSRRYPTMRLPPLTTVRLSLPRLRACQRTIASVGDHEREADKMPALRRDKNGMPALVRTERDRPREHERREINLGAHRLKLVDDDGRVMSPTESIALLLEDGPITDGTLQHLAEQYDDPEVVYGTVERLGAVRRKRDDGGIEIVMQSQTQPPESTERTDDSADDVTVEPPSITFADNREDESSVSPRYVNRHMQADNPDAVPVREAQRLLGAPVIGSGLVIFRDENKPASRERFVSRAALNAKLAQAGRGGKAKGAGETVSQAIDRAQRQRARDNAAGQRNDRTTVRDSRSRRYRRASELGDL